MAATTPLKEIEPLIARALNRSQSISKGMRQALQIVGKRLQWEIGVYWKVEPQFKKIYRAQIISLGRLNPLTFTEKLPRPSLLSNKKSLPMQAWRTRKPCVTSNLKRSIHTKKYSHLLDFGIHSALAFPIIARNEVIGVMEFFSRKQSKPDLKLVSKLNGVGAQLGLFIERKETEIALEESQSQLRLALQAAKMGHWEWDLHTNKVWWSENMEKIFGIKSGSFGGNLAAFLELVHPEDRDFVKRSVFTAVEGRADYNIEFRTLRPDGRIHWINGRGQAFYTDDGIARGMTGLAIDITDRKAAEEQLQQAYEEMERRVQERTLELIKINEALQAEIQERKNVEKDILEISQKEQRRFGSQLHDGLCQDLTGLLMLIKVLNQRMDKQNSPESDELKKISATLLHTIHQARNMARGLYPVELEGTSLMSSLQELCNQTHNFMGVSCKFKCPAPILIEDNNTATHLYRIAQESINNAVQHGRAKQIEVSLLKKGSAVTLTVKDDGTGLVLDIQNPKGIGLHIMKYRARMIDASLQLEPNSPQGVVLKCSFKAPPQKGKVA